MKTKPFTVVLETIDYDYRPTLFFSVEAENVAQAVKKVQMTNYTVIAVFEGKLVNQMGERGFKVEQL